MPNQILPLYDFTKMGQRSIWPEVFSIQVHPIQNVSLRIFGPQYGWLKFTWNYLKYPNRMNESYFTRYLTIHDCARVFVPVFLLSPLMVLLEFYVQKMSLFSFYIRLILKFFYVFYLTFNRLLKGLFLGLHEYISWILNLLLN